MTNKTAWEKAAEADGTTESERALTRLARKAFLSLWSYPNVYSDEGRSNGKGDDTSKLDEEMLQEDRSISVLLKNRRDELESVFGVDLIYTIDLLFNFKGGPCLRHERAHGKLASGNCYLHSSVYACWLMYYLACLPLLSHWKSHVAPHLEEIAL
ncbi:hypothetical protein NLO95_09085 [Pseudomonas syringae]|nr:hypothetical protein [Pseudomonas syringae]